MRVTEKIKQEVSAIVTHVNFDGCDSELVNDKTTKTAIRLLIAKRNLSLLTRRYGELSDEQAIREAAEHEAEYNRQPEWMGDVREHHKLVANDLRRVVSLRAEISAIQLELGNH